MATKNPRINITLEKSVAGLLITLAKSEHTSVSHLAKELILEAMERREDIALSTLAELRDTPKARKVKHDDAWK